MPISADTVLRLLNRMALPDQTNPLVTGADDQAKRKRCSHVMIVVDLKQRRVIDPLPNRTVATLAD